MQIGQPSTLQSVEVDVGDALNQLSPNSKLKARQLHKQGLSPDKSAPNSSVEQENAYPHDDTKKVSTAYTSAATTSLGLRGLTEFLTLSHFKFPTGHPSISRTSIDPQCTRFSSDSYYSTHPKKTQPLNQCCQH